MTFKKVRGLDRIVSILNFLLRLKIMVNISCYWETIKPESSVLSQENDIKWWLDFTNFFNKALYKKIQSHSIE